MGAMCWMPGLNDNDVEQQTLEQGEKSSSLPEGELNE